MMYPIPTLDHAVINVRDRIDEGAAVYRRLGFTLTPRGRHTTGSRNHLAVFGTDYLELIAAPPEPAAGGDPASADRRAMLMAAAEGLNGLVFGTDDIAATHFAMQKAGVPVFPPDKLSRPVALPEGNREAMFRTLRLIPAMVPSGRLYFCQHFTRDLIWRDEWRHHANGATGIERAIIVARSPADLAGLLGQMFGPDAIRPIEGGHALTAGLTRFDVVTPEIMRSEFGDAMPDASGRETYMAGLVFRTRSLDAAWQALSKGRVAGARREEDRVVVPATSAFGATLAFCH